MFDKKYDLIILDAYASTYVPYHLLTHEFYQLLEKRLEPDGIIISNLIGSIEGSKSPLVRSAFKTMTETFPVSYVFPTENKPTNQQNIMIVASNYPYEFEKSVFLERAQNSDADYLVDELNEEHHFYSKIVKTSDVPFLTDQFNPSEVLHNPKTGKQYDEFSQGVKLEDKEQNNDDYGINLIMGIALSVISAIWLLYFKKRVWQTVA